MKRFFKIVIPLLILFSGIAFLFFYNFYLESRINTVSVIVADQNISFKDQFTTKNLKLKRINSDDVVTGAVKGISRLKDSHLLGKLAAINIKKGTQIYPDLIDPNNLIPDESKGEFIAPIPNKWIFAVPGSIRRSYIADFYVVPKKIQQAGNPLNSSKPNPPRKIDLSQLKPILKNVRVAHTKDQSNNEVTNVKKGKRYDTTGVVSNIEIIATPKMLNKIRKSTENGNLLYIVYEYDLKG